MAATAQCSSDVTNVPPYVAVAYITSDLIKHWSVNKKMTTHEIDQPTFSKNLCFNERVRNQKYKMNTYTDGTN